MKILIVDDEQLARQRLIDLISDLHDVHELSEAKNGAEAITMISNEMPDLVLLDIRMPIMDGLETAHHLCKLDTPPPIVFTTAYQDHALEAFEAQAIDYLLKPIRSERLQQALEKSRVLQQAKLTAVQQETRETTRKHLSINQKGELRIIAIKDIRYFKAEQKYVTAVWSEGEVILDESLKSLEAEFSDEFIRIHRNTLVAIACIKSIKRDKQGNACIELENNDDLLPISRRHLHQIKKVLMQIKH